MVWRNLERCSSLNPKTSRLITQFFFTGDEGVFCSAYWTAKIILFSSVEPVCTCYDVVSGRPVANRTIYQSSCSGWRYLDGDCLFLSCLLVSLRLVGCWMWLHAGQAMIFWVQNLWSQGLSSCFWKKHSPFSVVLHAQLLRWHLSGTVIDTVAAQIRIPQNAGVARRHIQCLSFPCKDKIHHFCLCGVLSYAGPWGDSSLLQQQDNLFSGKISQQFVADVFPRVCSSWDFWNWLEGMRQYILLVSQDEFSLH